MSWQDRRWGLGTPKSKKGNTGGGGGKGGAGGSKGGRGGGGGRGRGRGKNNDKLFSDVVLLVNFNDIANVNTRTATDESSSGHVMHWAGGSGLLVTADAPPWQPTSARVTPFQDISAPNSTDFHFGSGDFTVEAYIFHEANASDTVVALWGAAPNQSFLFAHDGSPNELQSSHSLDGTAVVTTKTTATLSLNTWVHVAWSRVGDVMHQCENEVITAAFAITGSLHASTSELSIGSNMDLNSWWDGKIANVRITKGVGRYSGSVSDPITIRSLGPHN